MVPFLMSALETVPSLMSPLAMLLFLRSALETVVRAAPVLDVLALDRVVLDVSAVNRCFGACGASGDSAQAFARRPAPRLNYGSRDDRIFLPGGRSPAMKGRPFL